MKKVDNYSSDLSGPNKPTVYVKRFLWSFKGIYVEVDVGNGALNHLGTICNA